MWLLTIYVLVEETETPKVNKLSNETITTYSSTENAIKIYRTTGRNSSPTIGNNHINLKVSSTYDIKTEKKENDLSLGNNNEDKQSTTPYYGDILEKETKVSKTSTVNKLSPNTFGIENTIKGTITTQSEIKVLTEKQNTNPKDENIFTKREQSTREVTSKHSGKYIGSNANKQTGLWKETALEERSTQPDYDYITSSYKTEEEKSTALTEKTTAAKPSEKVIETQSVGSQETSLEQTTNIANENDNFSKVNIVSSIKGPNPKNQTFTESIKTSVEEDIMTKVPDIDIDIKPTKYEVNSSKDVTNGNSDALTEDNQYSMTTNNNPDTKNDSKQDISIATIEEEQVTDTDVTESKSKTTEYITSQQASQYLSVSPGNTEGPATQKGEWNSNADFYRETTKNQVTAKAAKKVSTRNPEFDNNLASESALSKTVDLTVHQWNNGIDKEQTKTNHYSNEPNQDAASLSTKSTELSETLTTTTLKPKEYSNEQNQDATSLSTKSTELSETLSKTTLNPKEYSNKQNQDAMSLLTKSTELSETLATTTLKSPQSEKQESTEDPNKITSKAKITEIGKTTSGGENFNTLAIDNDAKPSVSDQTPPQTTTCMCPTTSSSSSTAQATTSGILTTSGFCICPDTNYNSKEEETATNMPETKGRRRRRKEFEEMDLYVDNF